MFVLSQDHPASGSTDLFIDRVKVTSFESWAPLSRIALASPLAGDDNLYTLSGGTSMATPLVAGASARVRQAVIARGTAQPRAELIKAVLINTADPHSGPRPNNSSGWGLVNLRRALTASLVLDNEGSLSQGESMSYTIKVTDASQAHCARHARLGRSAGGPAPEQPGHGPEGP